MEKLKRYAKKSDYTYTLGSFPTFELLEHYPQYLKQVLYSAQTKEDCRQAAFFVRAAGDSLKLQRPCA